MSEELSNELEFPLETSLQRVIDSGCENAAFIILEFWAYMASKCLPLQFKYSSQLEFPEDISDAMDEYLNFPYSEELKDLFCLLWKTLVVDGGCEGLYDEMVSLYSKEAVHMMKMDLSNARYKGNKMELWVAPRGSKIRRVQSYVAKIDGLFKKFDVTRKMYIWDLRE